MEVKEGKKIFGKLPHKFLLFGLFFIAFFVGLTVFLSASAATPPTIITYQGKVLSNGVAATGTLSMKFVLYDALIGGVPLYSLAGTTSSPSAVSITPSSGLFTVDLGGAGYNTLDPEIFKNNSAVYLEVTINSEVLSPRKQIGASPYAFNAKYLDGIAPSSTSPASQHIVMSDSSGNVDLNSVTSTGILTIRGNGNATSTQWLDENNNIFAAFVSTTSGSDPVFKLIIGDNITRLGQIQLGVDGNSSALLSLDQLILNNVNNEGVFSADNIQLKHAGTTNFFVDATNGNITTSGTLNVYNIANFTTTTQTAFRLGTSATSGYVLTVDENGYGTWQAVSSSNNLSNGLANYLPYWTSATTIGTTTLYWDSVNGRLGIGTNSPISPLDVAGDINISGIGNFGQSINVGGDIYLPTTTNSTTGVIYLGGDTLLHTYDSSGVSGNLFFGKNAGNFTINGTNNIGIGSYSLSNLAFGSQVIAIGDYAMIGSLYGSQSIAIGVGAMANSGRSGGNLRNIGIGIGALGNTNGSFNTAIGYGSMYNNDWGEKNVALGEYTLYSNVNGSQNTALGYNAGYSSLGSGNVFLGHMAGYYETGSNKLYISNSNTTDPLIYGEFDNNLLRVKGDILPNMTGGTDNLSLYNLGASTSRWSNIWTNVINLGTSTWSLSQGENGQLSFLDAPLGNEKMYLDSNGVLFVSGGFGSLAVVSSTYSSGTISNSGFEDWVGYDYPTDWLVGNHKLVEKTTDSVSGTYALVLPGYTNSDFGNSRIVQRFSGLSANDQYVLSFRAKNAVASKIANVFVIYQATVSSTNYCYDFVSNTWIFVGANDPPNACFSGVKNLTDNYTLYSIPTTTVPSNGAFSVSLFGYRNNAAVLDTVSLVNINTSIDIIQNGDFENWSSNYYPDNFIFDSFNKVISFSESIQRSTSSHSGLYSLALTSNNSNDNYFINQSVVNLTPGDEVTFQFYAKSNNSDSVIVALISNSSPNWADKQAYNFSSQSWETVTITNSSSEYFYTPTVSSSWSEHSIQLTVPDTGEISFYIIANNTSEPVYIDDIALVSRRGVLSTPLFNINSSADGNTINTMSKLLSISTNNGTREYLNFRADKTSGELNIGSSNINGSLAMYQNGSPGLVINSAGNFISSLIPVGGGSGNTINNVFVDSGFESWNPNIYYPSDFFVGVLGNAWVADYSKTNSSTDAHGGTRAISSTPYFYQNEVGFYLGNMLLPLNIGSVTAGAYVTTSFYSKGGLGLGVSLLLEDNDQNIWYYYFSGPSSGTWVMIDHPTPGESILITTNTANYSLFTLAATAPVPTSGVVIPVFYPLATTSGETILLDDISLLVDGVEKINSNGDVENWSTSLNFNDPLVYWNLFNNSLDVDEFLLENINNSLQITIAENKNSLDNRILVYQNYSGTSGEILGYSIDQVSGDNGWLVFANGDPSNGNATMFWNFASSSWGTPGTTNTLYLTNFPSYVETLSGSEQGNVTVPSSGNIYMGILFPEGKGSGNGSSTMQIDNAWLYSTSTAYTLSNNIRSAFTFDTSYRLTSANDYLLSIKNTGKNLLIVGSEGNLYINGTTTVRNGVFQSSVNWDGTTSTNAFRDASFENNDGSWSFIPSVNVGVEGGVTTSNYYDGSNSFYLKSGEGFSVISQDVASFLSIGNSYSIGFYAKGANGGETVNMGLVSSYSCTTTPDYSSVYNFIENTWDCVSNDIFSGSINSFFASSSPYAYQFVVGTGFKRYRFEGFSSTNGSGDNLTAIFFVGSNDGTRDNQTVFIDAAQLENGETLSDFTLGPTTPDNGSMFEFRSNISSVLSDTQKVFSLIGPDASEYFSVRGNGAVTIGSSATSRTSTLSFLNDGVSVISFNQVGVFTSGVFPNSTTQPFVFDATIFSTSSNFTLFSIRSGGAPVFSVSGNGDVRALGNIYAASAVVGTPGEPGDLAERVDIAIDDIVEPGDVMMVDPSLPDVYRRTMGAHEQAIAGVISTNPTIVVGNGKTEYTSVMAMVGRVPVKVSGENGPINRGDLLVSASLPGYAMKYDPAKDTSNRMVGVVGIALDSFSTSSTGKIMVLVKAGWINNYFDAMIGIKEEINKLASIQGVDLESSSTALNVTTTNNGIGYVGGDLNLSGNQILNVKSVIGLNGKWSIDAEGRFVTRIDTSAGEKEMYALQSPVVEFVFSSSSQLLNGEARIEFDQETKDIIDPSQPLKVSVTLTSGEANGIYVSEKSANGFVVKELGNGYSNASFDWMVVAKRRMGVFIMDNNDNLNTDTTTTIVSITEQQLSSSSTELQNVTSTSLIESTSTNEVVPEVTSTLTTASATESLPADIPIVPTTDTNEVVPEVTSTLTTASATESLPADIPIVPTTEPTIIPASEIAPAPEPIFETEPVPVPESEPTT